jgi:hypothetical protein
VLAVVRVQPEPQALEQGPVRALVLVQVRADSARSPQAASVTARPPVARWLKSAALEHWLVVARALA